MSTPKAALAMIGLLIIAVVIIIVAGSANATDCPEGEVWIETEGLCEPTTTTSTSVVTTTVVSSTTTTVTVPPSTTTTDPETTTSSSTTTTVVDPTTTSSSSTTTTSSPPTNGSTVPPTTLIPPISAQKRCDPGAGLIVIETYEDDLLTSRVYTSEKCGEPVLPHTGASDIIVPGAIAGVALLVLSGVAWSFDRMKERQ